MKTTLWAYYRPLTNVASFNYIGRLLVATDENWLAVVANLRKYQKKWYWMPRIMGS